MFKFFIPIILLMFSSTMYFGYIKEQQEVKRSLKESIEITTGALNTQRDDIEKKIKELEEDRNKISQEDLGRLDRLVPARSSFDEIVFVHDVNTIAQRNGMTLQGLVFGGSSEVGDKFGTFSMGFSVTSTYEGFKKFMRDLEHSDQLIDISIASLSGGGESDEYIYSVSLITYWLP